MVKNLRDNIINDILFESGEISLMESSVPFSKNFFKWKRGFIGIEEGSNYGLPYFSSPAYYDDNEFGEKKTTRYTISAGKFKSISYMAINVDDRVFLGAKRIGGAKEGTGIREDISINAFLEEFYGEKSNLKKDKDYKQDIPDTIIDRLGRRVVSLEEYEEALLWYLLVYRYPKMFKRKLNELTSDDDDDLITDSVDEELMRSFRERMRKKREAAENARRAALRDKHEMNALNRQKDYEEDLRISREESRRTSDPFKKLLYQIEDTEREHIHSESMLKSVMMAHERSLKEIERLMRMYSFEPAFRTYTGNGLMNMLNVRYGNRTAFWDGSFWNVQ